MSNLKAQVYRFGLDDTDCYLKADADAVVQRLKDLFRHTLPHLEYKLTHTQTATGRRNVSRLIKDVKEALKDDGKTTEAD